MDKRQTKFLQQCPEVEKRLEPCFYTSYGDLCFYPDEWVCNNKCIAQRDVCQTRNLGIDSYSKFNNGTVNDDVVTCDWGLKMCGKSQCVSRYTPCQGKCWNDANPIPCGNNLCLNENQIRVSISNLYMHQRMISVVKHYFISTSFLLILYYMVKENSLTLQG